MTELIERSWDQRQWRATETAGLEFAVLREHDEGGATFFLRFGAGVAARPHTHPAGSRRSQHVQQANLAQTPQDLVGHPAVAKSDRP